MTAGLALGAALIGVAAAPADADGTSGTAYSAVGKVLVGSGLGVHVTPGGLLAPFKGVVDGVVSPLTAGLTSMPSTLLSGLAEDLVAAGLSATGAATNLVAPATGFPSCSASGWTSGNCYGPLVPALGLSSLLGLNTGVVQGYANGGGGTWSSRSQVAGPDLSVLGIDIGDLGVAEASASCATGGQCTASETLTDTSLLGGLVKLQLASGSGLLQVSLAGAPFVNISSLGTTLTPVNSLVSVAADGKLLKVRIGLDLDQLLGGLGLSGLVSGLAPLVSLSTTADLTLVIGPGDHVVTNTSAEAWGLGISLDLTADVDVSVLGGLASLDVGVDSGLASSGDGNLLDLELAYSNASAGSIAPPSNGSWVPPALV